MTLLWGDDEDYRFGARSRALCSCRRSDAVHTRPLFRRIDMGYIIRLIAMTVIIGLAGTTVVQAEAALGLTPCFANGILPAR